MWSIGAVIRTEQNFVCFLLGDSLVSEVHMPTDRVFRTIGFKLQMPVNHPEESIQHLEHGERLKSRTEFVYMHR
jgi:hypothetical protein